MKIKILYCLAVVFIFSSAAFSQTVVVTPKKTVYKRVQPENEFRRTFTINYPKVKAATVAVSRKIESALSYEKNFDFTLMEEKGGENPWLELADFEVGYNNNGVLSVGLFIEGTGAYPSSSTKWVVVDVKTGARIKAVDVFSKKDELIERLKTIQQEKIEANYEELKSDPEFQELRGDIEAELKDANFTTENLEGFSIDENGVTFHYNYGFRHAIQALSPDGDYFLSWDELEPFINPDGLLAKFIR